MVPVLGVDVNIKKVSEDFTLFQRIMCLTRPPVHPITPLARIGGQARIRTWTRQRVQTRSSSVSIPRISLIDRRQRVPFFRGTSVLV